MWRRLVTFALIPSLAFGQESPRQPSPFDFGEAPTRIQHEERSADYLGTALELTILLGVGTAWYVMATTENSADWQYDLSLAGLGKKLSAPDAITFDTNPLYLNTPGHAVGGGAFVLAARAHDLSLAQSLFAATLAAATWELATEFREQVSINDMVITPVGGLALGESMNQLSLFFRRSAPSSFNRLMAEIMGATSSFNPSKNREVPGGLRHLDERGRPTDARYDLAAYVGADAVRYPNDLQGRPAGTFGLKTELWLREAGRVGGSTGVADTGTFLSKFDLRFTVGELGLRDLGLYAEAGYAGLFVRDLFRTPAGVFGARGLLGVSVLYEHLEHLIPGHIDQLGAVALAGPVATAELRSGPLRLGATARAHPVFAAVRSLALDPGRGGPPWTGAPLPEVLALNSYYYAVGSRLSLGLELGYQGASLSVEGRRYVLDTVEVLRRTLAPDAAHLKDLRDTTAIRLAQRLPGDNFRLALNAETNLRRSAASHLSVREEDVRVSLQLEWLP